MTDASKENTVDATNNTVNEEEVEDWDRPNGAPSEGSEEKFASFGRSNGKSLAQLMSPKAGKDLQLSEEEEKRLEEELGKWINANPNPYEPTEDLPAKEGE